MDGGRPDKQGFVFEPLLHFSILSRWCGICEEVATR
jgi:hypothetical protein